MEEMKDAAMGRTRKEKAYQALMKLNKLSNEIIKENNLKDGFFEDVDDLMASNMAEETMGKVDTLLSKVNSGFEGTSKVIN